jgi:hypothetical protein
LAGAVEQPDSANIKQHAAIARIAHFSHGYSGGFGVVVSWCDSTIATASISVCILTLRFGLILGYASCRSLLDRVDAVAVLVDCRVQGCALLLSLHDIGRRLLGVLLDLFNDGSRVELAFGVEAGAES